MALKKCEGGAADLHQADQERARAVGVMNGRFVYGLASPFGRSLSIVGLKDGPPAAHKAEVWQD